MTAPGQVPNNIIGANRAFFNLAPEASLIYAPTQEWALHAREVGYGAPQPFSLFTTPQGTFGDNTQLKAQTNVGFDLGAVYSPSPSLHLQATGFYEFYHYDPPEQLGFLRHAHIYFEVGNLFNRTYVGSASNITDTLGANGQAGDAVTLAAHTGSIFAGNQRTFLGGVRVAF